MSRGHTGCHLSSIERHRHSYNKDENMRTWVSCKVPKIIPNHKSNILRARSHQGQNYNDNYKKLLIILKSLSIGCPNHNYNDNDTGKQYHWNHCENFFFPADEQ